MPEMMEFKPQSYKWPGYSLVLPEEMVEPFNSGKAVQCNLEIANDGNRRLIRASSGTNWYLMKLDFSGEYALLRGETHFFLASSGSWSGGGNYSGFIALKPGALVRLGAKGNWSYIVVDEKGLRHESHDPRLWEEGSNRWKSLD